MPVKITAFEAENVKRIKAVQITPQINGLTVIGGNNNQGKTSVLDAIAWALGGNKYRPETAQRDGAQTPPHLRMRLWILNLRSTRSLASAVRRVFLI